MLTMQGGDSLVGGLPIIHITYQQYIANPSAYHDPDVIVHISGFPTAGNMPADYVGYDSNLNMEDIGNIATKAIAKVEPSNTALYLHNVGTEFINKDGDYCITDVQISVGGTITLGTNCHVVSGGLSGKLTPQIVTGYTVNSDYATVAAGSITRSGSVVSINLRLNVTVSPTGNAVIISGLPTAVASSIITANQFFTTNGNAIRDLTVTGTNMTTAYSGFGTPTGNWVVVGTYITSD